MTMKLIPDLPLRLQAGGPSPSLVQVHPLPSKDGLLIKVQPPRDPSGGNLSPSPCDLVLAIDVSGSMRARAPAPEMAGVENEEYDLTVLDLVKHAARTILETLDAKDRLGIVTFASRSQVGAPPSVFYSHTLTLTQTYEQVLQPLMAMTPENKAKTLKKIDKMQPTNMTNLWHGVRDGLSLFQDQDDTQSAGGSVRALLVLTDGMPNHMCPQQGYVPKLRAMGPLPATIHTFGFGYELRSGLLKSIAEVGGGNYAFIPDAGMLVSCFLLRLVASQLSFLRPCAVLTPHRAPCLSMPWPISSRPSPPTPS